MATKKSAPVKKAAKKAASRKDPAELTAREKRFIDQFWSQARELEAEKERKEAEKDALTPNWLKWWRKWRAAIAWVVFGILTVTGFWRIETAIHEERETRQRFDESEVREEEEDRLEAIDGCKTRNFATRNGRQRDIRLFDALKAEFPNSDIVNEIRVQILPEGIEQEEDRDCDGDGELTEADYAN